MELAKGWARVGAWVTVGAGAVAALLGASALSMLAAMAQRAAGKAMTREIARAILGRRSAEGYFTRTAADYAEIRRAVTAAEMQRQARARAERKAAKAAKRAAREERKRMRREECALAMTPPWALADPTVNVSTAILRCHGELSIAACEVRRRRADGFAPHAIRAARNVARMAELRYAIACAEAGAVPGGRVH